MASQKKDENREEIVLALDRYEQLLEERDERGKQFIAISGMSTLDSVTDGFQLGQLITISGPSGHGKTTFCQTLTRKYIDNNYKVLWFSYELGYMEFLEKFPGNLKFYIPKYLDHDNIGWIHKKIKEAKSQFGMNIVFIDNLDFLRDPEIMKNIGMNASGYIGGIVQKLKRIAVEEDVIIFLMCHIRKNNWSSNELPTMEDIRDSGQIPQLSDFVLMIIRKILDKNSDEIYSNDAVLGIMKNRHNGKTKKIGMSYVPDKKMFLETKFDIVKEERQGGRLEDW